MTASRTERSSTCRRLSPKAVYAKINRQVVESLSHTDSFDTPVPPPLAALAGHHASGRVKRLHLKTNTSSHSGTVRIEAQWSSGDAAEYLPGRALRTDGPHAHRGSDSFAGRKCRCRQIRTSCETSGSPPRRGCVFRHILPDLCAHVLVLITFDSEPISSSPAGNWQLICDTAHSTCAVR